MVVKMNNKSENFYSYMGNIFGSRLVQKQINDRIYDDPKKEWYLYIHDNKTVACVSVMNETIKNVYTVKEQYLEKVLKEIKKDIKIKTSIVPKLYQEIYVKCEFKVYEEYDYKNFIAISY